MSPPQPDGPEENVDDVLSEPNAALLAEYERHLRAERDLTQHTVRAYVGDIEALLTRFPALKERRGQTAGTLSGGEQQMLAVARALMSRPKLLMMDEPSMGLAPLIVERIFNIVQELNRDGITIFMVEQNAHMALKVAHKFFLMEQGKVTFAGTPGEVAEDDVIQRAYLGSVKTP